MSRRFRHFAPVVAVVLAAAALPALSWTTAGAADDSMYTPARGFEPTGAKVRIAPDDYVAVEVDLAEVRTTLAAAPGAGARSSLVFAVPSPDGGTERFTVRRTRIMESKLAQAHPEIATYAGRSVEHPGTTIALDVTPMGFHASVRGPNGQGAWYVDPAYNQRGTLTHLSYYGGEAPRPEDEFVERNTREIENAVTDRRRSSARAAAPGELVQRKFYRLALTSDPSYADYFGTENVLAEKATLIHRVNQVYNDDLAIHMILIDESDKLNLDTDAKATGADGPCGAHPCFDPADPGDPDSFSQIDFCSVPTLGRNRTVLGQLVGASDYDVGHIGLGVNGGGIAYLGVVGWDYKGGGCTGLPEPKGDFFAIDYVAHEIGHQFSGNHTFNGVEFNCSGGNRNPDTSVEPGSGSSVMAYAGICGPDDLQPHTDPYFSQRTLDEVNAYTGNPTTPVIEVQTVSLRGFDTDGDEITLGYADADPVTLTRGVDYNPVGIEAAVEELTGEDVTIAQWGYDPFGDFVEYPAPLIPPDDTGFQVIFAPSAEPDLPGDHTDKAPLTVSSESEGVSGFVGETARGGEAQNEGYLTEVTANHAPGVTAPADKTIPMRTPFSLRAKGNDTDGDKLTYLWEQNDIGAEDTSTAGGTSLVDNDKENGPLFRVFGKAANVSDEDTLESPSPGINLAGTSPLRTFPDLQQILAGNTNAKTGECPEAPPFPPAPPPKIRDCFSEFLPVEGYVGTAGSEEPAMNFRVTARDGYPNGGGVAYDDVVLRLDPDAGPFLVKSQPKEGVTRQGGQRYEIRWQVNGTRPLANRVKILLSTNGGKTFGKHLVETANDGAKKVTLPKVNTNRARIKIKAVGNYFFAVNDGEFRIRK